MADSMNSASPQAGGNHVDTLVLAINKACRNGFDYSIWYTPTEFNKKFLDNKNVSMTVYFGLIFLHDFAKALWGETKPLENGEYPPEVIMYKGKPMWHPWKHHLQNMVIADDPIKYLGDNI